MRRIAATIIAGAVAGCLADTSGLSGGAPPSTLAPGTDGGVAADGTAGAGAPPPSTPSGSEAGAGDAASGGSAYAAAVLADHPLVYLRLGESGAGVQAADASGHGADGAYLGSVTRGVAGAIVSDPDTAALFDGSDGALVRLVPSFDFGSNAPFSLELWVKPSAPIDGSENQLVVRSTWCVFMQSEILKFQRQDLDNNWDGPWFTTALARDRFTHVVGTYDGASLHLYIDGLDVGQAGSARSLPAATDPIQIGANFPGALDEIAIYDHPLTAERVHLHHQVGAGTP